MNLQNICAPEEAEFLLKYLKHTDRILEWGSGKLALQIANKVKHICVITHDLKEYGELIENKPENIEAIYMKPNAAKFSGDGTFQEFEDYINASVAMRNRFGKFNAVIIRGRARVACSKMCRNIAWPDAKVFIQDYNHPNPEYLRKEYFECEKHLTRMKGVFTMYLFKIEPKEHVINVKETHKGYGYLTTVIPKKPERKITELPCNKN